MTPIEAVLIGLGGLLFAALATTTTILQYRRTKRSSVLTDFSTNVGLWKDEIAQLKATNARQTAQIEALRADLAKSAVAITNLTEQVTSAAKVDRLIETIASNHTEMLAAIRGNPCP
jgi:hypothetical protein